MSELPFEDEDEEQIKYVSYWNKKHPIDWVRIILWGVLSILIWVLIKYV